MRVSWVSRIRQIRSRSPGDQLIRIVNICFVTEHDLAGDSCERIDRPRILFAVDLMQQFTVAAYSVSQAQSGELQKTWKYRVK